MLLSLSVIAYSLAPTLFSLSNPPSGFPDPMTNVLQSLLTYMFFTQFKCSYSLRPSLLELSSKIAILNLHFLIILLLLFLPEMI